MLLSVFRKASIPDEESKDLAQDVFVKLMTLDIIIPEHLMGLAVTIAYQKRTDWLRHQAHCRRMQSQWRPQATIEQHELEYHQLLDAERDIINRMSNRDAWIYKLSRFDEKTPKEITTITTLSLRAVEGRLYRTRKMVRKSLKAAGF